ncbi:MAG: HIT domain-containing protein [Candidatus Omnitrophica bacterium]|nr:HIT domain-containing protein [Candidatus Omnitrophota bacterium]
MDILWAPWRMRYIKNKPKDKKCIFCQAKLAPHKNYVFIKSIYSMAMLNIYPYNNGHAMVFPLRHTNRLSSFEKEELWDIYKTINNTIKLLDKTLKPHGYNLGINLSDIAGAGIKNHLHIHIVPRWRADTNFMPVISNTKVISQSIEELYKQLIRI